jgi:hypothetical protein
MPESSTSGQGRSEARAPTAGVSPFADSFLQPVVLGRSDPEFFSVTVYAGHENLVADFGQLIESNRPFTFFPSAPTGSRALPGFIHTITPSNGWRFLLKFCFVEANSTGRPSCIVQRLPGRSGSGCLPIKRESLHPSWGFPGRPILLAHHDVVSFTAQRPLPLNPATGIEQGGPYAAQNFAGVPG